MVAASPVADPLRAHFENLPGPAYLWQRSGDDYVLAGYLAGPKVGASVYNALHTTIGPIALVAVGVLADTDWCVQLALIWLAHIGLDRLLGYGLKYPSAFKDTHLERV